MAEWLWPAGLRLDLGVLLLAFLLDLVLPDIPTPVHPVGWIGRVVAFFERLAPVEGRAVPFLAGAAMAVFIPLAFASLAGWIGLSTYRIAEAAYLVFGAILLKSMFTVSGLRRASLHTSRRLKAGDLEGARESLRHLVSRNPEGLSPPLVAGAAVESVAENTTDSYLGPWLAFALLGLPGAVAYRAINTLDSMIGYRGRYEFLGKASARLDDLVNLAPARISAGLLVGAGALTNLASGRALRVVLSDHAKTSSPNAGWTMSAMAGLLGVRLDKPGHYSLGSHLREPNAMDIERATGVMTVASVLGLLLAAGVLTARVWVVG